MFFLSSFTHVSFHIGKSLYLAPTRVSRDGALRFIKRDAFSYGLRSIFFCWAFCTPGPKDIDVSSPNYTLLSRLSFLRRRRATLAISSLSDETAGVMSSSLFQLNSITRSDSSMRFLIPSGVDLYKDVSIYRSPTRSLLLSLAIF
ncbi:hypothetical protein DY000_02001241 [Brassica cretica]|uniref:Uncharacterized protein n=1 Tax=Brassica cretica TaxID=69181 RepID=A0ABQ7C5I1_BRACR|nr:hypothetical protein DY000_02001241 [Brassica cretica]